MEGILTKVFLQEERLSFPLRLPMEMLPVLMFQSQHALRITDVWYSA